jgi:hypothetical protein
VAGGVGGTEIVIALRYAAHLFRSAVRCRASTGQCESEVAFFVEFVLLRSFITCLCAAVQPSCFL